MTPRATLRLQFHPGFTLDDAVPHVPYYAALGISHVYASPLLTARAGSMHGYDGVDPTRINPELGGEPALQRLVDALQAHGMGLVVDIVPNHMAVGPENPWWMDVLAHGERSAYARWFDIDWHPLDPALDGKLLLPVLGKSYGEALADGELGVTDDGAFATYFDHRFPLDPDGDRALVEAARAGGADALHALFEAQAWRLAWWACASDTINWRRFFDVHELVGMRVEEPAVFDALHATVLRLVRAGAIQGLRIDHVDGLADPGAYLRQLRDAVGPEVYIVVEKILARDEVLPADWPVDGTTGYDFMNQVNEWLHQPAGAEPLAALWADISGRTPEFEAEALRARRELIDRSFSAQRETLVAALHRRARADLATRDVSAAAIRRALTALLLHYPVYRGYGPDDPNLAVAGDAARHSAAAYDAPVLERIVGWLRADADARLRFSQLSAPLAAKAIEDTAFYRYGRLLSRNDVGFEPAVLASDGARLHRLNAERRAQWPHAMLASATHDHKRGEDLRARLAVLSERPDAWREAVARWQQLNAPLKSDRGAPSGADEYMLYQTLTGGWPEPLAPDDRDGLAEFEQRVAGWQQKALREAKLESDWLAPDEAYEAGCRAFLAGVLDPGRSAAFLADLAAFVAEIFPAGAINGLVQTTLKYTVPGVPDLYQGSEYWGMSLVDPDNRRAIEWERRMASLQGGLPQPPRGPVLKQQLIARLLAERRAAPDLFSDGAYVPLPAPEEQFWFERQLGRHRLRVRVARWSREPLAPDEAHGWRNVLDGFPAMPIDVRANY